MKVDQFTYQTPTITQGCFASTSVSGTLHTSATIIYQQCLLYLLRANCCPLFTLRTQRGQSCCYVHTYVYQYHCDPFTICPEFRKATTVRHNAVHLNSQQLTRNYRRVAISSRLVGTGGTNNTYYIPRGNYTELNLRQELLPFIFNVGEKVDFSLNVMEEEDFGFTERDLKVLRNVLVSATTEGSDVSDETSRKQRPADRGTGAEHRDDTMVKVNDGDNVTGYVEGGGAKPETGSDSGAKGRIKEDSSVAREPPSIPNVVEYHLKVKTPSSSGRNGASSSEVPEVQKKNNNKLSSEEFESKMALENKGIEHASAELPQTFQVKYLGSHDARGLWGIKHTRRPVDNMVTAARSLPAGTILPFIKLIVSKDGVALLPFGKKRHDAGISKKFSIDTISYGVQDLVYTRVFSMIVVRDMGQQNHGISPFECHGFVCESRHHARQLTYALANAFQIYSINVKAQGKAEETAGNIKKRFAIDLRTPEEIEAELTIDSEA